jgi:hypothetical protein
VFGDHNVTKQKNKGVCPSATLPFTLKSIIRQTKNYGKTQIFHHAKNMILKKNPLKETKILENIITNLKFQHKPKYHLSKTLM